MNRLSLALLLLLLALPARAGIVETAEVLGSPHTFAACTAADYATTVYAVHSDLGYEANPLLGASVNAGKFLSLLTIKVALVLAVYWLAERYQETKYGVAAGSVITCGVAAHNLWVIAK